MRRSEINQIIREAKAFFAENRFALPPFAHWTPDEWKELRIFAREIVESRLGWDLTDFNTGNFAETGLTLFTLRNGNPQRPAAGKPYAEKVMMVRPGQMTPWHFHHRKMEDIIVRGGGTLIVQVHASTADAKLDEDSPVEVSCDGLASPGGTLYLEPGNSLTIPPGLYHRFWADPHRSAVLVGEVSSLNDDLTDNHFLEPLGRFPVIEEDEPAEVLLCSEYPEAPLSV